MEKGIIVLDGIKESSDELCTILKSQHYPIIAIQSLPHLEGFIQSEDYIAVIIDIDSVAIDNRTIRQLALKYPGVRFLCTSKDRFHPELKDAICYHIDACLNKPVDPDELLYWIKSIYEEENIPDT
jgi:DNA-binding NtrC family response regulator